MDWLPITLGMVKDAIKKLPFLNYAIAAYVFLAIVATAIMKWKLPPDVAVKGFWLMVLAVPLLVLLKGAAALSNKALRIPAIVAVCSIGLIFLASVGLFFTSAFFGWPRDMTYLVEREAVRDESKAIPEEPKLPAPNPKIDIGQDKFLRSLGVALKEPDEVFNQRTYEFRNTPIMPLTGRFKRLGPKPEFPSQGRQFFLALDDNVEVSGFLKPGIDGKELEHLKADDPVTLTAGLFRDFLKSMEMNPQTLTMKRVGLIRISDCEYKRPL